MSGLRQKRHEENQCRGRDRIPAGGVCGTHQQEGGDLLSHRQVRRLVALFQHSHLGASPGGMLHRRFAINEVVQHP